jgi:general secretion pathway protein D
MVNLADPALLNRVPGNTTASPGTSANPGAINPAPVGRPAPATIGGVRVPKGAVLVEDPQLVQEILKATGR